MIITVGKTKNYFEEVYHYTIDHTIQSENKSPQFYEGIGML